MVVDNFDVLGAGTGPTKAYPPLIVDPSPLNLPKNEVGQEGANYNSYRTQKTEFAALSTSP